MTCEELINIYNKFPAILRNKLIGKEIELPSETKYEYDEFSAFRGITREADDYTPVNIQDMRSHYELKPRGKKLDEKDPSTYAVSVFKDYEDLAMSFHFPRPKKKLARICVYAEGGPQCGRACDSHVDWWLYKNVDFSNCEIKEDFDG